jgi:hypothetical protein
MTDGFRESFWMAGKQKYRVPVSDQHLSPSYGYDHIFVIIVRW